MSLFNKKKILVTHNGTFHTDEIFATAALSILFNGNIKVIRTRDPKWFEKADFLYDLGGEYNPSRNRFDHHQPGGAGKRENGIPYATFGLIWKTYGEKICGSKEIAEHIDQSLVQSIDAPDNGLDTFKVTTEAGGPYTIDDVVNAFRPSWKEDEESDEPFFKLVDWAKEFLLRKISKNKDRIEGEKFVKQAYDQATDKRLIVLPDYYPWRNLFLKYPEPLYVVVPRMNKWNVYATQKEKGSFENRKSLPKEWAGLRDEALAKASGVADATFCHNALFLAVAKSKEGAIELAKKALES